ncbi:MAG: aspartate aminotransferase family protein [Beijerinckiaceae bacterium]|nr:aspartate aminotransferase family protein [Beijerinckiaceae bacterium]
MSSSTPPVSPGQAVIQPNDLEAFWLPYTSNRAFKRAPRLVTSAEGTRYLSADGRGILDGTSGLWCCNAGHARTPIVSAIQAQAQKLDFAPPFQFSHPQAFALASRVAALAPGDLDHVFFTNSGSESVETALKIALGFHNVTGQGGRQRLIGRERGYHGVGFGGTAVGGMVANRKIFGTLLAGVDHLPTTYNRAEQAFTVGEPEWGGHLANDLERLVALHDASTIAAVIVEPMGGSTGVLPSPKGYLQRLRDICDQYGILLIFDEVITGFGRLGASFAAERYGVVPDMITFAKGITSGTVPMGGVIVRKHIYDAFMKGPDYAVELFHGYTYSAHPLACAAALATLDLYREERLFERSRELEPILATAIHALRGEPNVVDIRSVGLAAAVELAPIPGAPGQRGYDAVAHAFDHAGVLLRAAGDSIITAPPLIIGEMEIGEIAEGLKSAVRSVA